MWICEKNARCVDECDDCQHYIEVEPVRHGVWEEFDCDYGGIPCVGYYCSECGHAEMTKYPYCNCGAKMDGE